ncbi:hypothetical protein J4E85_003394 [Alternaria conjuncta]|uniref:uncharacterized protein n=1 Tax=Alternaria conjuncta TaxID=181017 RepID=UPI00221F6360|nr:uncharacterized protein J4E85_003394 [Alternaria conjuncta]KAI4932991.1 hypothetical protein J4E85_003394 [Alternaria conjuncta]
MARGAKRARADSESSQFQPQLPTKRQREPEVMAAQVNEEADDTTAADDVRYMRTQPKAQAPTESSRAKSFPSQTSTVIDLTLSDELDDVFPSYLSRLKAPQDQADNITVPDDVQYIADVLAGREKARLEMEKKSMESAMNVMNAQRSHTSIMFTPQEAIAFLWQPQLAITYDLPTGDYVPYPVHRSYHLGGMGRYADTRAAMHTSLPYRPSGAGGRGPRANDRRSDRTEAHGRFA